jgi:hypothetical protein
MYFFFTSTQTLSLVVDNVCSRLISTTWKDTSWISKLIQCWISKECRNPKFRILNHQRRFPTLEVQGIGLVNSSFGLCIYLWKVLKRLSLSRHRRFFGASMCTRIIGFRIFVTYALVLHAHLLLWYLFFRFTRVLCFVRAVLFQFKIGVTIS